MRQPVIGALAGIEYHGSAGISAHCKRAVQRLIQCREDISSVRILSCQGAHALLLVLGEHSVIAVKSGFASGYSGEGPRTLAEVLDLLSFHAVDIEEVEVPASLLERVNASALTNDDLAWIGAAAPIRPQRWHDYCYGLRSDRTTPDPWHDFPAVLPLAHIDHRLADLAREFDERPDGALLTAYKRLEDVVRMRTKLDEHGTRLFSQAFARDSGPLCWSQLDGAEHQGRLHLFVGTYMAFRNARAHRELKEAPATQRGEFLLINELFRLESQSVLRDGAGEGH